MNEKSLKSMVDIDDVFQPKDSSRKKKRKNEKKPGLLFSFCFHFVPLMGVTGPSDIELPTGLTR